MIGLGRLDLAHPLIEPCQHPVNLRREFTHRPAPVADLAFLLHAHLGEGSAEVLIQEDRIIAEPRLSPPLLGDAALTASFPGQCRTMRHCQREDALEAGGAVAPAFHLAQQLLAVVPVRCLFAAVAGRIHARRTVQCVHGQAGVVSQRGQAENAGVVQGLFIGVLLKGRAVLHRLRHGAEILQAADIHRNVFEQCPQLLHFIFIAGGEHNDVVHKKPPEGGLLLARPDDECMKNIFGSPPSYLMRIDFAPGSATIRLLPPFPPAQPPLLTS